MSEERISELEGELIKRNREIAKVRDDVHKAERKLEDAQMRNDDLLEKMADLDSEVTKKSNRIKDLEAQARMPRNSSARRRKLRACQQCLRQSPDPSIWL